MPFLTTISSNGKDAQPDDLDLVAAYRRSKDLKILAQLYQRYLDLIYGVCLKYLEDKELAKDASMDIFEDLTTKLLRHEVTNFKGWLYTLTRNHCLMQLRSGGHLNLSNFDPDFVQTTEEMRLSDIMEK